MRPAPGALLLLALLPGCAPQSAPSAVDALEARAAVDSLWAGYARAADRKDAAAFEALFVEDAALDFSTAPTVRGREAIRTFLVDLYAGVDPTGLRVEPDETKVSGAVAVQSGTLEERYIEKDAARTEYGRFVLVAEKGGDGAWKIRRLVAFTDSIR